MSSARRDVAAISLAGCLVGATPVLWTSIVWGDVGTSLVGWLFIFAVSLPPFAGAAALRARRDLGRASAILATIAVSALSVFGQAAALNPHDESSTASLALFVGPVYGIAGVAAIYGAEQLVRAVHRQWDGGT